MKERARRRLKWERPVLIEAMFDPYRQRFELPGGGWVTLEFVRDQRPTH